MGYTSFDKCVISFMGDDGNPCNIVSTMNGVIIDNEIRVGYQESSITCTITPYPIHPECILAYYKDENLVHYETLLIDLPKNATICQKNHGNMLISDYVANKSKWNADISLNKDTIKVIFRQNGDDTLMCIGNDGKFLNVTDKPFIVYHQTPFLDIPVESITSSMHGSLIGLFEIVRINNIKNSRIKTIISNRVNLP